MTEGDAMTSDSRLVVYPAFSAGGSTPAPAGFNTMLKDINAVLHGEAARTLGVFVFAVRGYLAYMPKASGDVTFSDYQGQGGNRGGMHRGARV